MQGFIAQLLSIAAHGNEYLGGRLNEDYFPNSSIFEGCEFVKFVDVQSSGRKWYVRDFAQDPNEWFRRLKETGVVQFRVRYVSTNKLGIYDRSSVAFVGGGRRWLIEAVKPKKSDFWEARWEVGDRDDPEQKFWHVKYGRILRRRNLPGQPLPPVLEVKKQLKDTLQKISQFAHKNNYSNFGKCFDRGLEALEEPPTENNKAYAILPESYAEPEYHQLMNASQYAWVFGGMGSWNDVTFNDSATHREYEELSDKLFNLVTLSLLVASNPFPRPTKTAENDPEAHILKKWWQFWVKG